MILSHRDILKEIDSGEIAIEPFDASKLKSAAVPFCLGDQILIPQETSDPVDPTKEIGVKYLEVSLADEPFVLEPGQFVLGHTLEKLTLSKRYGMHFEGRSTLARLGVSVVQASTIVEPGHTNRPITLEMFNAGQNAIRLSSGLPIAKGLIYPLSSEAAFGFDETTNQVIRAEGVDRPGSS